MRVLDEMHSGTSVDLLRGEVLAIRLKENATTGYRWSVADAGGLQALNDSAQAGAGHQAPGAAGIHEFRFLASEAGTHALQLRHWRDWQGEGSVIGRYSVDVRVS